MISVINGDALTELRKLPAESVQCCVTSPPYWGLRDYGIDGQLGLEKTPEEYVTKIVEIFREVSRVLRDDGTLWLNLGDSYAGCGGFSPNTPSNLNGSKQNTSVGSIKGTIKPRGLLKPKDLVGIPWRVAFALQADGWYLRSDIIWHKPAPMPESVTDRPTNSHEYIFLLSKSQRYYYDAEAIRDKAVVEGGRICGPKNDASRNDASTTGSIRGDGQFRNKRTVWTIATHPYKEAHFATFPEKLPKLCILAGSKPGDMVLEPFAGSGTTLRVALELGRHAVGIELNPEYCKLIEQRCNTTPGMFL
jgi:DNA modification methylase